MNQQIFVNNLAVTLAAGITSAATSIPLATGSGAKFSALANGDYTNMTLTQAGTETSTEVVKVTAISGDTATVVRGVEGTAAAWAAGDKFECRNTAGFLNKVGALSSVVNPPVPRPMTASGNAVLSDSNGLINANSAATIVITIPLDATAGWSSNEFLSAYQAGTGIVMFAAASGVTLHSPSNIPAQAQFGTIAAYRVGANEWTLV